MYINGASDVESAVADEDADSELFRFMVALSGHFFFISSTMKRLSISWRLISVACAVNSFAAFSGLVMRSSALFHVPE